MHLHSLFEVLQGSVDAKAVYGSGVSFGIDCELDLQTAPRQGLYPGSADGKRLPHRTGLDDRRPAEDPRDLATTCVDDPDISKTVSSDSSDSCIETDCHELLGGPRTHRNRATILEVLGISSSNRLQTDTRTDSGDKDRGTKKSAEREMFHALSSFPEELSLPRSWGPWLPGAPPSAAADGRGPL